MHGVARQRPWSSRLRRARRARPQPYARARPRARPRWGSSTFVGSSLCLSLLTELVPLSPLVVVEVTARLHARAPLPLFHVCESPQPLALLTLTGPAGRVAGMTEQSVPVVVLASFHCLLARAPAELWV